MRYTHGRSELDRTESPPRGRLQRVVHRCCVVARLHAVGRLAPGRGTRVRGGNAAVRANGSRSPPDRRGRRTSAQGRHSARRNRRGATRTRGDVPGCVGQAQGGCVSDRCRGAGPSHPPGVPRASPGSGRLAARGGLLVADPPPDRGIRRCRRDRRSASGRAAARPADHAGASDRRSAAACRWPRSPAGRAAHRESRRPCLRALDRRQRRGQTTRCSGRGSGRSGDPRSS